jgi:ribosome-associated protein
MPRKKKQEPRELFFETVAGALADKKARNALILDFKGMNNTVCDAFIICHGTSRTQVEAIAGHVTESVKKATGLNPSHTEGFENSEWILIDYFDVIIHIFQEERRKFYNIEQLWADAVLTRIDTHE